jgi:hypothetical protein
VGPELLRDRYLNSWWLPRLLSQSGPELSIGEKGLASSETSDTAKGTTPLKRERSHAEARDTLEQRQISGVAILSATFAGGIMMGTVALPAGRSND